jgi:cytochrome P450 family 109
MLVTIGEGFQLDFAELVPVEVMALMLGSDMARTDDFRRWTGDILSPSNRSHMNPEQLAQIRRSVNEAREYFLNLIAYRRKLPGDDIISSFIAAQDTRDELSDGEILSLCILLLNGGNETTAHLLGNTLVALWDNPEQFELLRAEPHRVADAVDESLRFDPPVQTVFLWTMRDVELDDVKIPVDSAVIGVWGSANRDEAQFPEPDRFDITREKHGHMAFGYGPHFCLGNMLARQEVIITLERVFECLPRLRRATEGPVDWIPSFWIRGPRTLPITF